MGKHTDDEVKRPYTKAELKEDAISFKESAADDPSLGKSRIFSGIVDASVTNKGDTTSWKSTAQFDPPGARQSGPQSVIADQEFAVTGRLRPSGNAPKAPKTGK